MRYFFMVCMSFLFNYAMAGDCQKVSSVCVDASPYKMISGVRVTLEQAGGCWDYEDTYTCLSHEKINDCQPLRNQGCAQIATTCISTLPSGMCAMSEQTYQCQTAAEISTQKTVCDQSTFCQSNGTGCFDTSAPADKDFAYSAVMLEAAREAGVYGVDPSKIEIFKGYREECSVKVLGGSSIKSCCSGAGGGSAFTNYAVLGVGVSAAGAVGRETVKVGSKYVYDTLYQSLSDGIVKQGLGAMSSWASTIGGGALGSQFGAYGFQFSFSMANGFQFVGFDPYTFAASVAIMMVQKWLACDSKEQVLSMKKGQSLCVHTGSYCSKKTLGACTEKKEKHCCFNSKLAKIINRQGRIQIGLPIDSCSGFNQEQLQAIDFAQIDLSEFIADVMPKTPDAMAFTGQARKTVDEKVKGYYDQ
jgi:conjugal transfer mating pair stabilization protein TraN